MRRFALLLAIGLVAVPARGEEPASPPPHRVLLVVLGGGVRPREMLDPETMPGLVAAAERGLALDKVTSGAGSTWGALQRILTGRLEGDESGEKRRPEVPTLLEELRRRRGLPAEKAWFVGFDPVEAERASRSDDPDLGAACAPAVAAGMGAFAEPLENLLEGLGRPVPTPEGAWPILRGLRARNRAAIDVWLPREVDAGLPESERVERAILAEVDRQALLARGPSPEDERTLRAAATVLAVHRPVLTVVSLAGAEQAQVSMEKYLAVLKAADAGIARLRAILAADPVLKGEFSVWVVADRGRNATPYPSGGLGADDASPERRRVALVAEGRGVRRGGRVKGDCSIADLSPTLGRLLGVETPRAEGVVLESLLGGE